jgi:hypothetical protein
MNLFTNGRPLYWNHMSKVEVNRIKLWRCGETRAIPRDRFRIPESLTEEHPWGLPGVAAGRGGNTENPCDTGLSISAQVELMNLASQLISEKLHPSCEPTIQPLINTPFSAKNPHFLLKKPGLPSSLRRKSLPSIPSHE